ncbi:hypothetical protein BSKO_07075 [Bryopsis sp. KO-2023]|nr:hypothetical protein BSKO_07075 [Bryopsis sp. KO-2023]
MSRQALIKVLELVGAAAVGAAGVLAFPLVQRWSAQPVRVLITGAAGQIGYALAPLVARGQMLGHFTPIILHLLDIGTAENALNGVAMELQDGSFPLVQDVLVTIDVEEACKDVDVAILVAGSQHPPGATTKDMLSQNVSIYKSQASALAEHASRDVKIVVVANPANTNALVLKEHAPSIPPENITCLTRLDHNRALARVADLVDCHVTDVKNVAIWGNKSFTQYPDVHHAVIMGLPVIDVIGDDWVEEDFIASVKEREATIFAARNLSTALSAASAVCDHMRDWLRGTPRGEWVSMGVISDGSYGVPEGLMYSFPVYCKGGKWQIVQELSIDEASEQRMKATADELVAERAMAFECLSGAGGS